jgi:hypothetical protein
VTPASKSDFDSSDLEYVPADYQPAAIGTSVLWSREPSASPVAELLPESIAAIERLLDYRLSRTLHVVVYASNEEACRALGRRLSATALLAPLHTRKLALIALQAPGIDARNGDRQRLRRHVCHELSHVFSAERTGSVKRLGDDDRGMRLSSWVDEGFAENVAASAAARPDVIEAALKSSAVANLSDDQLAVAFRDLNSADRGSAFATATTRIWRALQAHGFEFVFENLSRPERWSPG